MFFIVLARMIVSMVVFLFAYAAYSWSVEPSIAEWVAFCETYNTCK